MATEEVGAKELQSLATVVANDASLSVTVSDGSDNGEETGSYIDYKTKRVVLSDRVIPRKWRDHPELVGRFRQAMVQHEAQHYLFTKHQTGKLLEWVQKHGYPDMAQLAHNLVEDYRVNMWQIETYRLDIGKRVEWMVDVFGYEWRNQLAKMFQQVAKKGEGAEKEFAESEMNFVINGMIQVGLYGVTADDFRREWENMAAKQFRTGAFDDMVKGAEIIQEGKYTSSEECYNLYDSLYVILEKYARKQPPRRGGGGQGGQPGQGGEPIWKTWVPRQHGGTGETEGDSPQGKKEVEEAKKHAKLDDSPGEEYATHAGKGAGTQCDHPEPDMARYAELVNSNMPHIKKLLDRLKRLMQIRMNNMKYQKSGKLMSKQIAKYAVQRRVVEDIYQRKKFTPVKSEVRLCLVVDMSGSMSTTEARDVLTVISEVGGRWLNDNDLSIFVFGDEYAKVKTFNESYQGTRARIGGVECMGGTTLGPCLANITSMFRAYDDAHKKICVVVSDFCVFDEEEVKRQMGIMRKEGIIPVGVGYCGTRLENVKEFTGKNSTYVPRIEDLPELFFDIFRRAAMT